ncbi:phenylacetic acid degradation bifunctional protein PaaZ [Sphingomonas naphthae]|uniref:Phenylacetic acid degradation bifunctional protein PaaZ n=1 Tax=Sphingomonas naphthae TaxID=1813468 RepID=A0ABY7TIA7_9SPHN|nr:phenylacetic acid degradation bifunctional protein PaaZ [Sphingomonas naphthae]WCT72462.1 phenylacetic acid degradation bifunctional protein PaaZ [Sphingomonas naphthae]
MKPLHLMSYVQGGWYAAQDRLETVASAVTGETVAELGTAGIDFAAMARHARQIGGPALRAMTFHERARMLKALAEAIMARKEELYALSAHTGATRGDGWIDIEGGAGTLFAYSSKGRRELPNDTVLLDGPPEILSKRGTFLGQHIYTPLQGVAVHINAFNFPCWGMLEKLGPTLLAGVPAIVKPASSTAYVTEACVRIMLEAGVLPDGALQLLSGSTGDLLDHLTCQDIVSFTGSAATAQKIQSNPVFARESVRFVAERDSLNATVLGPDATPDAPEFDLFVKEVVREMTTKAGQKCTAIRRTFVPRPLIDAVEQAIAARLAKVVVGDPAQEGVTMGALVSERQLRDVRATVAELAREARIVFGDPDADPLPGGAFLSPILLRCDAPWEAAGVHDKEAFGPVSTLMPYDDVADAIALCNRGQGSLVMSLFTYDPAVAAQVVAGAGAWHGRVLILDRDCARESTGHGSPLPGLVHGGPGRAGGGEEMGGIRGVHHYMQRTALQGSPRMLAAVGHRWVAGAPVADTPPHPFRLRFGELEIGKTVVTEARTISLADIEHFAEFTGDTFYAHMDEEAAAANPFFPGRVAHGYLILSFAAGLFVDPAPGPVLANYGLDSLRFLKPVSPGDAIRVRLTAKAKSQRNEEYGEVRWDALVTNQEDETVATYELLTMNAL